MATRNEEIGIAITGDSSDAQKAFDDVSTSVDDLQRNLEEPIAQKDPWEGVPNELRQAFQRAESAARDFEQRVASGAVTGQRDLKKVTIAQTLLNIEIEKSGKTLDKLGPEATAAYSKLEAAQKKAITTTSRLAAELDDANIQTNTGVTGFTGFGNAAEAMGGKIGSAAEGMGMFTGALVAGIAAGQQFNQLIGTDMQAQSTFFSLLAMRMKGAIEGIAEAFVTANQSMIALATGDWGELKRLSGELSGSFDKVTGAITKTDSQLYEERDALKAAEDASKKLADENAKLEDAQKKAKDGAEKFAAQQKKLAEEQKKLKAETDAVTKSIAEQTAEMEKQRNIGKEAKSGETQASRELKQATSLADQLEEKVQAARDRVSQLTETYGEDSAAVKNAIKDLIEYESSLAQARQTAGTLAQKVEAFNAANAAAEENAKKAEESLTGLRGKQAELAAQTQALTGNTETFNQKIEFSGRKTVDATTKMELMRGVQQSVGMSTDDVSSKTSLMAGVLQATNGPLSAAEQAQQRAGEAAKGHAEKQDTVKGAVEATTTALTKMVATDTKPLEKKVDDLLGKVNALTTAVNAATTAMDKLAGSGGEGGAESDRGSISITRSGEGSGPLTGGLGRAKGATGW